MSCHYICLDGIDGAGKTTHCKLLALNLSRIGIKTKVINFLGLLPSFDVRNEESKVCINRIYFMLTVNNTVLVLFIAALYAIFVKLLLIILKVIALTQGVDVIILDRGPLYLLYKLAHSIFSQQVFIRYLKHILKLTPKLNTIILLIPMSLVTKRLHQKWDLKKDKNYFNLLLKYYIIVAKLHRLDTVVSVKGVNSVQEVILNKV